MKIPRLDKRLSPKWAVTPACLLYIDAAKHSATWTRRAAALDRLIANTIPTATSFGADTQEIAVLACVALTVALESLNEGEINNIDQALCYYVSMHPRWNQAAT